MPERALSRAKFLDEYLEQHGVHIGPLHGLPISVKEHIGMKGLGLNAGYIAWWDKSASEDARVLQILYRAGAVFYARTTQPQSLMHLETDSNLYGVTTNPYNTNLSAGGSSGGEGALVGARGSCLGIGTDIGGMLPVSTLWDNTANNHQAASEAQLRTMESMVLSLPHSVYQPTDGPARHRVQTQ